MRVSESAVAECRTPLRGILLRRNSVPQFAQGPCVEWFSYPQKVHAFIAFSGHSFARNTFNGNWKEDLQTRPEDQALFLACAGRSGSFPRLVGERGAFHAATDATETCHFDGAMGRWSKVACVSTECVLAVVHCRQPAVPLRRAIPAFSPESAPQCNR